MKLRIIPVNEQNELHIRNLKVKNEQVDYIETTSQCLDEALELSLWKPVGIYDQVTLVGFAMYGLWQNEGVQGRVWLDRFLIDENYQGKGYGKIALNLLVKLIFEEYQCAEIFLSLYEENLKAITLYQKQGFFFTGEVDEHGEKVMKKIN